MVTYMKFTHGGSVAADRDFRGFLHTFLTVGGKQIIALGFFLGGG